MSGTTLIIHHDASRALHAYNTDTTNRVKTILLDLSDGGEIAFTFNMTLKTLLLHHRTTKELFLPQNAAGRGLFEIWDALFPDMLQFDMVIVMSDPLRMLDLHCAATTNAAYGIDTLRQTFRSFYKWLSQKGFVHCHILTSRVPTELYKCITQQEKIN